MKECWKLRPSDNRCVRKTFSGWSCEWGRPWGGTAAEDTRGGGHPGKQLGSQPPRVNELEQPCLLVSQFLVCEHARLGLCLAIGDVCGSVRVCRSPWRPWNKADQSGDMVINVGRGRDAAAQAWLLWLLVKGTEEWLERAPFRKTLQFGGRRSQASVQRVWEQSSGPGSAGDRLHGQAFFWVTQASLGASPPPSWAGVKVEGWSVPPGARSSPWETSLALKYGEDLSGCVCPQKGVGGLLEGWGWGEGWWNRQEASPCMEPEVSTLGVTPFLL